jgi:hypothetical protein
MFPGSLSLHGVSATWPVNEGIAGFLDLAASLGARIVYMKANSLSQGDLIDAVGSFLSQVPDALDAETPEAFMELAGVGSDPEVEEYLRQGMEHYGQLQSVRVEWVLDGVVHRFEKYASWSGALIDRAAEIADLIERTAAD